MPELICTVCPRGCRLTVDESLRVSGNFCKRGETYGKDEVTNPVRTLTSTVRIESETVRRLPVKTSKPVPKHLLFALMKEINKISVKAPVAMNQVLLADVLSTGADIIATRNIEK